MRVFFVFLIMAGFTANPATARTAGNDGSNDSRTRAEEALDEMRENARNNPSVETLRALRRRLRQDLTDLYSRTWQPGANTLEAARERNRLREEIEKVDRQIAQLQGLDRNMQQNQKAVAARGEEPLLTPEQRTAAVVGLATAGAVVGGAMALGMSDPGGGGTASTAMAFSSAADTARQVNNQVSNAEWHARQALREAESPQVVDMRTWRPRPILNAPNRRPAVPN